MAKRIEVIDFKEFVRGDYKKKSKLEIVLEHVERHKVIYKIAGVTIVLTFGLSDLAFADSVIDEKAKELYYGKLIAFGKWAIIIKGGWDTIAKALKEDFDGAKRSFLSYLIVFVILLCLPWSLEQVEEVFGEGQQ